MKKQTIKVLASIGILACCLNLLAPNVAAQATKKPVAPTPPTAPTNSGQALEIAPPVLTLTGDPGQTIKADLNLRNVSNTNLVVKNQINDFTAAGDDGTPKLILDDETSPYSIKGWLTPLPELVLVPKQIKTLPITINIPKDASPGGHYGVVRFTGTPAELEGQGVTLSASLGSLMLITVNGAVKESLEVQDFTITKDGVSKKVYESTPLTFTEKIKNTGNIHEKPAGQVTITDMFGKKVATLNVNLPPRNILPQTVRKFEQPLDSSVIGNRRLFGRYSASMKLTYGTNNSQSVTASTTFWVIPWKLIAMFAAAIVVIILLLVLLVRFTSNRAVRRSGYNTRRRRR